jgi:hypothetical protein
MKRISVSAYKWLVLADDAVKDSAGKAQELRKLLAPAQIAQAEHEIDEWRTAHPRAIRIARDLKIKDSKINFKGSFSGSGRDMAESGSHKAQ